MYGKFLEVAANISAIVTAVIAAYAYGRFRWAQRSRRKALENYLREEKLRGFDMGKRSVLHLMANLGMTEAEVFQAVFESKLVRAASDVDWQGDDVRLNFEYDGDDVLLPDKL